MSKDETPAETATRTLREVAEATERLLRTVAELEPSAVGAPSALPGWTRGHVLAHISRNADSLVNLLETARTGVDIPQYASTEARDQGIEDGSGRPLDVQLDDLRASNERFVAAAAQLPDEAWSVQLRHRTGYLFPASELPWKRLMEIEYHHVDLDAGYTPAQWPFDFAMTEMLKLANELPSMDGLPSMLLITDEFGPGLRSATAPAEPELTIEGPVSALAAWLSGRSDGDGLRVHRGGELLPDPRTALPKLPPMG